MFSHKSFILKDDKRKPRKKRDSSLMPVVFFLYVT